MLVVCDDEESVATLDPGGVLVLFSLFLFLNMSSLRQAGSEASFSSTSLLSSNDDDTRQDSDLLLPLIDWRDVSAEVSTFVTCVVLTCGEFFLFSASSLDEERGLGSVFFAESRLSLKVFTALDTRPESEVEEPDEDLSFG